MSTSLQKQELQNWTRKPKNSAWWAPQESVTGISSTQYYCTAALLLLEQEFFHRIFISDSFISHLTGLYQLRDDNRCKQMGISNTNVLSKTGSSSNSCTEMAMSQCTKKHRKYVVLHGPSYTCASQTARQNFLPSNCLPSSTNTELMSEWLSISPCYSMPWIRLPKLTVPSQTLAAHFLCMKWHEKGKTKLRMLTQPLCLHKRKFQELRGKIPSPFTCANSSCWSSQHHHSHKIGHLSDHGTSQSHGTAVPQVISECKKQFSEIWIQTSLNHVPCPSLCYDPQPPSGPTSSIPPRTSFPAVPWSLCQHLFCTPEHGWGTAGTICRHSETLCPTDFEAAWPCKGLTEVTSAQVHGFQCCGTAPTGTDSPQLWLQNCIWRKTSALCSLQSQPLSQNFS